MFGKLDLLSCARWHGRWLTQHEVTCDLWWEAVEPVRVCPLTPTSSIWIPYCPSWPFLPRLHHPADPTIHAYIIQPNSSVNPHWITFISLLVHIWPGKFNQSSYIVATCAVVPSAWSLRITAVLVCHILSAHPSGVSFLLKSALS